MVLKMKIGRWHTITMLFQILQNQQHLTREQNRKTTFFPTALAADNCSNVKVRHARTCLWTLLMMSLINQKIGKFWSHPTVRLCPSFYSGVFLSFHPYSHVLVTSKDIDKYHVPRYKPPVLPPQRKGQKEDGYYLYKSSSGNEYAGHWKNGRVSNM